MEAVTAVLLLIGAVVVSGFVARIRAGILPLPLVQIGIGVAIDGYLGMGLSIDPELFFLLFLPPLLFLDGWRISKDDVVRYRSVILGLALGLVALTVFGVGYLVNWLAPAMPLGVAFALAAVISPTDPVAVAAISARAKIPERLMHILEGEALLNDASGLVCMRFAVAAVLTGGFSLGDAIGDFLWLASGGVAIGVVVTLAVTRVKWLAAVRLGEEAGSEILISLLIPFGAYLVAERLGCSGILAAVAAGVTMSYVEQTGVVLALTRLRRSAVWDAIQFAANGIVFVLLGEQLPKIMNGASSVVGGDGVRGAIEIGAIVLTVYAALVSLRIVWVYISMQLFFYSRAEDLRRHRHPNPRLVLVASLAGVRGAVTLAGVMTLPLTTVSGAPFPSRDLAILLAAGVIIVSLIAASVSLPKLLKNLRPPPEPSQQRTEDHARTVAADAAIAAIAGALERFSVTTGKAEAYAGASATLMADYRGRIDRNSKTGDEAAMLKTFDKIERELRLIGYRAERDALYRLARTHEISHEVARRLVSEVDFAEAQQG